MENPYVVGLLQGSSAISSGTVAIPHRSAGEAYNKLLSTFLLRTAYSNPRPRMQARFPRCLFLPVPQSVSKCPSLYVRRSGRVMLIQSTKFFQSQHRGLPIAGVWVPMQPRSQMPNWEATATESPQEWCLIRGGAVGHYFASLLETDVEQLSVSAAFESRPLWARLAGIASLRVQGILGPESVPSRQIDGHCGVKLSQSYPLKRTDVWNGGGPGGCDSAQIRSYRSVFFFCCTSRSHVERALHIIWRFCSTLSANAYECYCSRVSHKR